FLYVPSAQPLPNTSVLWVIKGSDPYTGPRLGFRDDHFAVRVTGGIGTTKTSQTVVPRDRWMCVEMEVFPVDATTSGLRAWLDDVPLGDLTYPGQIDTSTVNLLE